MMGRPDAPAFLNRRDGSGIRRRKQGSDSVNNGALKKLLDERRNTAKTTKAAEDLSKKMEALEQELSELRVAHGRLHERTAGQIGELFERREALNGHNKNIREDVASLRADLEELKRGVSFLLKEKNDQSPISDTGRRGVETSIASRSLLTASNEADDSRKRLKRKIGSEKKPPPLQQCEECGAVHLCTFRGYCDLDKNREGVDKAGKCHNFLPKCAKPGLDGHPGYEYVKGDAKLGRLGWHPRNSEHQAWVEKQNLVEQKREIWRQAKKKQKSFDRLIDSSMTVTEN